MNKLSVLMISWLTAVFFSQLAVADEKKVSAVSAQMVEERIRSSVNRVLQILKDKKMEKEAKKDGVRKVLDPLFDFPLMSKLVLGPKNWPKFSEPQRKEFTELFVKALQDSYFEKVDLLTNEYVEFDRAAPVGEKFQMLTHIIGKDRRYKMLFKLYLKQNSWLVYDVEIEGVSFVRSYGLQYDQFLLKSSVKELLTKLREKSLDVPEDLKTKKKTEPTKLSVEKSTP